MRTVSKPISDLIEDLTACIEVGDRALVWGEPGLGKTAVIMDTAKKMGLPRTYVLIGSLCDPTDINGFPVVTPGEELIDGDGKRHPVLRQAPRDWMVRLNDEGGLLFLDELSNNSPAIQASLLRGLHEGVFGDFPFDLRKVAMVAAANRPDSAANGQELSPPMSNRFTHLEFPCTTGAALEWAENFPTHWGKPPRVGFRNTVVDEKHMLVARSYVSGFIRRRPELWHATLMNTKDDKKKGAAPDTVMKGDAGWPSARAWYRASTHIGLALSRNEPVTVALKRVAGAVGEGAGTEFTTYAQEASLPDPEYTLAHAAEYKPTGRLDVDFSTLLAVGAAVLNTPTPARLTALLTICNQAATNRGEHGPAYEAATAVIQVVRPLTNANDERYIYTKVPKNERQAYITNLMKLAMPFKDLLTVLGAV
jgi:hypothetical protein